MLSATAVDRAKVSILKYSGLMLNFSRKMKSVEVGGEAGGGSAVGGKFSRWRSLLIEVLGASLSRACLSDRKVLG